MFIDESSVNQEQDHRSNTGVASKEVVSVISCDSRSLSDVVVRTPILMLLFGICYSV